MTNPTVGDRKSDGNFLLQNVLHYPKRTQNIYTIYHKYVKMTIKDLIDVQPLVKSTIHLTVHSNLGILKVRQIKPQVVKSFLHLRTHTILLNSIIVTVVALND